MIKKYPDGASYAQVPNLSNPVELDKFTEFVYRVNNYIDLWELQQTLDALDSVLPMSRTVIIPNLIDAQADKRFNKNESTGLKLVCEFLNNLTRKYGTSFKIFHPHNPEVVEALMDDVEIIDNSGFILKVFEKITDVDNPNSKYNRESKLIQAPAILSPAAGMYKYMGKICDKIGWKGDFISASKIRKCEDDKSVLNQQLPEYDFEGKDILITDDMCVYGGTFKGLAKMLKKRNCGKLYLAVSHMTVKNLGEDPVTNYFDTVFCSNSKFDTYYSKNSKLENLNIIKLF